MFKLSIVNYLNSIVWYMCNIYDENSQILDKKLELKFAPIGQGPKQMLTMQEGIIRGLCARDVKVIKT